MLAKRLIGAVIVRDGLAVQSIAYKKWLPIGKPEIVIENLCRWNVDEIAVLCIDRNLRGPDLDLLKRITDLNINTPLMYGGGILNQDHAVNVIRQGAERISVDQVISSDIVNLRQISSAIGSQAVVAALPLKIINDQLCHYDYIHDESINLLSSSIVDKVNSDCFSEVMIIDVVGEGGCQGFNMSIFSNSCQIFNHPLLPFGGFSTANHINNYLSNDSVSGIIIGNALNYAENSVATLKSQLPNNDYLRPFYPSSS